MIKKAKGKRKQYIIFLKTNLHQKNKLIHNNKATKFFYYHDL